MASADLEVEIDALELNDRAADVWGPLLAVACLLGADESLEALTTLAMEMHREPERAEHNRIRRIARSLRKVVNGSGAALGMTSDFVKHLLADGLNVEDRELNKMLVQWGFSQQSVRLEQGPRRAWELPDSRLAEIEQEAGGQYPPAEK